MKALEIPLPSLEEQQKKADEYTKELTIYKDTNAAAEKRWSEVVDKASDSHFINFSLIKIHFRRNSMANIAHSVGMQ